MPSPNDAPRIFSHDPGIHNADLETTRGRLIEGATWKKQRVIKITPSAALIPARVALTHECLIFPPNQAAHRMLAVGHEVGIAYSMAIEAILAHPQLSEWEYILTVEADNCPPPDGVLKLIEQMERHPEFACIGGLYFCKGPGGCAHIWGDIRDPVINYRPQPPVPGALIECYGTSMGFNLWRMGMFRDTRLHKPWFETKASINGVGTQDLAFWSDARKYGYRCAVDCSVLVGHWDQEGRFGPQETMW
jgi:hypothetical protein